MAAAKKAATGNRPAATVVEPRPGPQHTSSDAAFEARRQQDEQAIAQANARRKDKLGEALFGPGAFYTTEKTWPFLMNHHHLQYSVSRWYPKEEVAVDIFQDKKQPDVSREIEFKRRAFAAAGIRYGVLDYGDQPADLVPQIGLGK